MQEEWHKQNDGRYQHGDLIIQFPLTPDEECYQFHLYQWLLIPDEKRPVQQVESRRLLDGKPQYCMSPAYRWVDEEACKVTSIL